MWNAYLAQKTVAIASQSGTAGVSVSGAAAAGAAVLRPLQVATTTFTITTDGAPILRARYVFRIDD